MSEIEDNYTKCVQILNKYWGHKNFRPLQWNIIESVLNKKTPYFAHWWGKMVCFQVPALAIDGMCIVVTPLIALMKDQVMQLNNKGINATAIHSGMKRREIDIAIGNSIQLKHKFLYLSPKGCKPKCF